jgi:hypothetical protein
MGAVFEPFDYPHESPATEGLGRLRGDGWSAFVKVVRAYRHWPRYRLLPADVRQRFDQAAAAWRHEIDLYQYWLERVLPPGMRLPYVHGIVELGDDRVLLVLEDVAADPSPWDIERYANAARRLGRLNVRMSRAQNLPGFRPQQASQLVRNLYTTRLLPVVLPQLAADVTWRHPLLAPERQLRADLAELARRLPALVEQLADLTQLPTHGDATPHNLLVDQDDPQTFVVIDWAMAALAAVGDDLGQLLIGHAHEGILDADDLPTLHDVLLRAYLVGLATEGGRIDEDVVRLGMDGGLAVRSAFTALPLERLDEAITDELAEHVEHRVELTRYLVDLGLQTTRREALVA